MDKLFLDLRDACRSLARRPGLALAVAGSLALAIGAETTVFSYVDFLVWADLPVRAPDRLVAVAVESREVPERCPERCHPLISGPPSGPQRRR